MPNSWLDAILNKVLGPPSLTAGGVTPEMVELLPQIQAMQPGYTPGQRQSDMVEDRRPASVDELVRQLTDAVAQGRPTMGRAFNEMALDDAKRWLTEGVPADKQYMFRPPPMAPRTAGR